jgi:hypothetical protein
MFHVIPKRAFVSDAAYESFFHALESGWASAQSAISPAPAATVPPVQRAAPRTDELMPDRVRTIGVIALAAFLAAGVIVHAAPAEPAAVTADGGRYYGALVDGKFEGPARMEWDTGQRYEGTFAAGYFSGHGHMQWPSGHQYEGEFSRGTMSGLGTLTTKTGTVYVGQFERGMFNGNGRLRTADGRVYEGSFRDGDYDGRGRFARAEGDVYEGDFQKGEFTGEGTHTAKDGARHEGRFQKWRPSGPGRYTDASGNVYEGNFKNGDLVGVARLTGKGGRSYEGEVRYWRPHGEGELRLPNGDIYKGAFEAGTYHGKGTLRYAKARPDGITVETGVWSYGSLLDEKQERQAKEDVELALYNQRALLEKALGTIAPHDRSRINLYFLGVAGDGTQEVFRREIEFVRKQFDADYGTSGRSVALINSRTTIASTPLATITSIREALKAIATRMDTGKDILFFYMTSHGSRQHEFTLNQANIGLRGLSAVELGKLLKESGIRYKVVVIGACYSGGFIDAIKDDSTLVITAARRDRQSFGCADENDFTYFGRAFFKESLPTSASFQEAFRKADVLIREWEARDFKADDDKRAENHSLPQISETRAITQHLERWWSQLRASTASAMPFKSGQLGN